MDNFERQFPSLSEFGKQFETEDFQPKANGLVGPYEHDLQLPDVSGLPDLPDLPSVPSGAPSNALPPPPSRPDRLDSSNSGRPDEVDGPGVVEPPPDSWNSIKRVVSEPTVTAPGDTESIEHADNRQDSTSHSVPEQGPVSASGKPMPQLPPKPKFPYTNAIQPETVREYVLNPSVKMLLLDVRTEEEYKKGYVGKEYEPKGYSVAAMWLDPTVLTRSEYVVHVFWLMAG
jgi:ubiquitin carboxyl-terminal hydrolase 8